MEGRVDRETRGRQRVLQSHRLEGFGAGRGDVRQVPCAFEAVLQVDAGERCGQLAQIRGWGADRAGQLAETPVGEGDGLGSTRPPPATAIAGGGQFHNLRSPAEIATTFMGELGELLAVAVRDVRLEIEGAPGTTAEMISPY